MKVFPVTVPAWMAVCMLIAMLVASPVGAAQPEGGNGVSLDQLMATLRTVRHVEAHYVERRTMHILNAPLETRGTLRFDAPDFLEKRTDPAAKGPADQITIQGNQLTIDRGTGSPPVVLMLNEHPEIGILIESIRATLSGDGAALRRFFDISLAGTIDHWQFVLQPREPAQRRILQWMRVTGSGERISAIDTQDADGDHSKMAIVNETP
jgi:hypothetical protein